MEGPGTDLEIHSDQSATLFRTDDPVQVLTRATETADALKSVLISRGMTSNIRGREHVNVEGWQTLGTMLGVTPVCSWTRPLDNGWEARVEARTLDGRVVGAAEAMCTRAEKTWKNRDDYALRSMAQTRATSKALASPLRFVITLAGYEGTPAEEMPEPSGPEGFTLARLNRSGANLGDDTKRQIGTWLFEGGKNPNPKRLRVAIEMIEADQLEQLMGRVQRETV